MQENQIILQGITFEQLVSAVREVVRDEITSNNEVYELTKAETCRRLEISFPTLQKRMKRENLKSVKNTDLIRLAIK